jgi:hypothetical protein
MTMRKKTWSVAAVAFLFGALAVQLFPAVYGQPGQPKGPKWLHGLSVRVRRADEADFTKDTKRVGVEVFRDENNGNLIYVTEAGSIAVVKEK